MSLTLASICMTSGADKAKNIASAISWIRAAKAKGADWVLLPEVFTFIGPYEDLYANAEDEDGPTVQAFKALAKELSIVIFAGSMGERPRAGETLREESVGRTGHRRVFNTTFVFGRQGEILAKYRKIHPFNLLDNQGQPLYCESDGFLSGDHRSILELDGYRVAMTICYDLRFPALYERLSKEKAVDVFLLPSAFTTQTGMDHWEVLIRARAIEQQAYMYSSNQVGESAPGKSNYGHSMIVDPWGFVLANTGASQGIALAEISRERLDQVRSRLPALKNRRPDIYE